MCRKTESDNFLRARDFTAMRVPLVTSEGGQSPLCRRMPAWLLETPCHGQLGPAARGPCSHCPAVHTLLPCQELLPENRDHYFPPSPPPCSLPHHFLIGLRALPTRPGPPPPFAPRIATALPTGFTPQSPAHGPRRLAVPCPGSMWIGRRRGTKAGHRFNGGWQLTWPWGWPRCTPRPRGRR